MSLKAWQPQVVEVDGEVDGELELGTIPQVVPSPRSKAADRECFRTLSWIITYFSANDRFRESFQT